LKHQLTSRLKLRLLSSTTFRIYSSIFQPPSLEDVGGTSHHGFLFCRRNVLVTRFIFSLVSPRFHGTSLLRPLLIFFTHYASFACGFFQLLGRFRVSGLQSRFDAIPHFHLCGVFPRLFGPQFLFQLVFPRHSKSPMYYFGIPDFVFQTVCNTRRLPGAVVSIRSLLVVLF